MSRFKLVGLNHESFAPLFDLSSADLARRGIITRTADSETGFPCRISLEDAAVGDELLLLHYTHHSVASPYRASGPIYIRRGQSQRTLAPGVVPEYVARRVISLRAYDAEHMMLGGHVSEGALGAQCLDDLFADSSVAYVHLHNAMRGCFLCLAQRE